MAKHWDSFLSYCIVGHTDFDSRNICEMKWDKINKVLGENVREGGEGEWVDVDAG